jgi:1,4-dihydroxy-2-naphthoate octaprenyltransferase
MDKKRLPIGSAVSHAALMTGNIDGTSGWVAQSKESDLVIYECKSGAKPALLYRLFKSLRAISLTATLLPAIAIILLSLAQGLSLDVFTLSTALLAMLMLQVAVNVFNDVEDYLKLIDLPDSLGGSGVIQSGWLSASQMNRLAWVAFGLACLLALPAIIKAPEYVLICAALAGLGVLGYSGKPFRFKYRALGDVFVFLLCGPVLTLGVSIAATNTFDVSAVLLGVFFGLLACGILNANNINDIHVDSQSGAQTLASVLGFEKARWLQLSYYAVALISLLPLAWLLGGWLLLPWLVLPLIYKHISVLFKAQTCDQDSLAQIRFDAAKLHMALSVMTCLGLFIIT